MLRCVQTGISIADLELLTMGMVYDIFIEAGNDDFKYPQQATQADFDKF